MKFMSKTKKRLIFICAALVISVLLATASVFATSAVLESKSVGVDKALAAALEANELDATLVEETSVKLRIRDGVAVYIVKLEVENVKYFVTVNAETGEVIESVKNECIRPEKPECPEKNERPERPEKQEKPSDETAENEETKAPTDEKPEHSKKPDGGKGHGKGHGKNPHHKGPHGNKGEFTPPTKPENPEVNA